MLLPDASAPSLELQVKAPTAIDDEVAEDCLSLEEGRVVVTCRVQLPKTLEETRFGGREEGLKIDLLLREAGLAVVGENDALHKTDHENALRTHCEVSRLVSLYHIHVRTA